MTIDEWTQTLGPVPLLLIALGAIAALLALIIWARVHAFIALILVSFLTAFATGIPTALIVREATKGFGSTLASVALLVGLGAMLGRIVETSGGATALAEALVRGFGEQRAPMALGVASLLFGFPIFFDAGLVVMLPVVFAVARRLGGSLLLYGLPAVGAFSVMHVFLPPHPGPVTAATVFQANVGLVLIVGLIVAIPSWYLSSYLFGKWAGKRWELPIPSILGRADEQHEKNPPAFRTVVGVLLAPMLLIFLNTGLETLFKSGVLPKGTDTALWYEFARFLGQTPVALLLSVIVAGLVLGLRRVGGRSALEQTMEQALAPVCSVILITGAGGMFGSILRTSGIGTALEGVLGDLGVPLLLAGFLIAAALRIAQGSATVALTTTAGLLAPAVLAAGLNEWQLAAMTIAVAAGSVIASHVNDSGFWLVGRFFEMDVKTTLKTWTVLETLVALFGFGAAALVYAAASLV